MNLPERRFVWDEQKACINLHRHGVSFEEARQVFGDAFALTVFDEAHSAVEDRYIMLGVSGRLRLLFVVHALVGEQLVRVISARKATRSERQVYEANLP